MSISKNQYSKMAEKASPPSPKFKNIIKAFLIGGLICCLGQALFEGYKTYFSLSEDNAKICVSVTLIVITAILTGIGVFDKIAKHAGAGTIVPITGFA
ncbi:MAG: SpoVA/SpoVAEb family sporulation membrane protein, partial [Clostridia bacterium]|nr:SpoVA/SpoVAEb family sporulation membrane protein [Clostridia bacterium]